MLRFFTISFLISILALAACERDDLGQAPLAEDYPLEVEEWQQERIDRLKEPHGWLRLSGMFWLSEGNNSFGSGEDTDIRFPEGAIPERAGNFVLDGRTVTMIIDEGVEVTVEGDPVSEMILFDGDETPEVEHNSLMWHVIERDDLIGIRLYNSENEQADNFDGFPRYDVDPEWHRKAKFIPNPEGTTISIANVLGQQIDAPSPGVLEFSLGGEVYTLDALEGPERLFIIVGDETNRTETYQAGRYLYIDYPEEGSNYTVIDFNTAYNPPCSYNRFTTCQLPPLNNRLDLAIEAGEKRPVGWDGL